MFVCVRRHIYTCIDAAYKGLEAVTLHCTWARMLAAHNYKKAHVRARTHTDKACTVIH